MRRIIFIICLCLATLSCERRELTYNYNPTVEVLLNVDWSGMSKAPTGMSVYCYPEDGGDAIIAQTNKTSQVSVELPAGVYNILVFNQIPDEFGSVDFSGLERFESAQIKAATTRSSWATTKADVDMVGNPEEVAAATYLDLVVSEDDVREAVELKSATRSTEIAPFKTLSFTPQVVTKTTRVRIRLSAIYNYRSTRATLYGMASGYHFCDQRSHTEEVTHLLESWRLKDYDGYREGEVSTYFTSFGLPDLHTSTRSDQAYEDWDGELDLEILLVDNKTIITEVIPLADKVVTTAKSDSDTDQDLDVNVDINIESGFGESDSPDDDTPLVLPDVEPVGGSDSGFDAEIKDWETEEQHDVEI